MLLFNGHLFRAEKWSSSSPFEGDRSFHELLLQRKTKATTEFVWGLPFAILL